jgi:hypothetical protein
MYILDNPLVHNLNLIKDWKLFGTVKFNAQTSIDNCIKFYYDFIRGIEKHGRGQWLLKLEGSSYNDYAPNRHIHFLLADEGLKETISDLKHRARTKINLLKRDKEKDYNYSLKNSTIHLENYDKKKRATYYVAKLCGQDTVNLSGLGLDSAERSNWKLSPSLKRRMRKLNETPCGY